MRTVLNALVKCLFSIGFIAVHSCRKVILVMKTKHSVEDAEATSVNDDADKSRESEPFITPPPVTSDPRVSLLGPLPHYYSGYRTDSKTSKTKYI